MKTIVWPAAAWLLTIVGICPVNAGADDRTVDEFKEYVRGVAGGQLNEDQLNQFAKMVDKDGNGNISDAEFEDRMESFRRVLSVEDPKGDANSKIRGPDQRMSRRDSMNQRMQSRLDSAGISPGKSLPDVSGLDINGNPFKLADLKGHFSVIVSGCLT